MPKVVVFLSHISEEVDLALATKDLIETAFLDLVEVFVSSDPTDIAFGQRWLDEITRNLKTCDVELILCSPISIKRPWINFEAGAGWIRDIPVIPICHSGQDRSKLPVPLSLLQAANAHDVQDMRGVVATIASALNSKAPSIVFDVFMDDVEKFEAHYMFWNHFDSSLKFAAAYFAKSPDAYTKFASGIDFQMNLTEVQSVAAKTGLKFLIENNLLSISQTGGALMDATGDYYGMSFTFTDLFRTKLKGRLKEKASHD